MTIDQYRAAGMAKKKMKKNNCNRQLHCSEGAGVEEGKGGEVCTDEEEEEEKGSDVVGEGIVPVK